MSRLGGDLGGFFRLHIRASDSSLSNRRASLTGRGRHWNFDPLQCLGPRPDILNRYISLSCLRWLPTACHERLAYFHWPQWVTWLVTWWVTWSRWPEAGRHIGKFSLWTTLLRFSRSAQISLFSNFTKLGQLFFDNIFFGLTSQGFCADQNYPWKKCIKSKQSKRDREKLQPLFNIPLLNTAWQSSGLCALDTLEYSLIQSIKKVWEILFSRGEKPLNPAQFATCPPSVFRHSRQANSALSGPKFRAGGPKFCTGPIICTGSKFCLVLDLIK